METTEELREFLTQASQDGVLGRLLYRGAAWSLMRANGVLPDTAPPLGPTIETDLAEYGFSLLRAALRFRSRVGGSDLANKGFERAASAFEALVRNGDPEAAHRGFRKTINLSESAAPCLPVSQPGAGFWNGWYLFTTRST